MTRPHSIEELRVEVPTLEPDPVLLAQLVELSSASTRRTTTSRASSVKMLVAAAGVAVVATTSWAAGAVPGHLFPLRPASHPHTVVPPSTSPSPAAPTVAGTRSDSRPTSPDPGLPLQPSPGHPGVGPGTMPSVGSLFGHPGPSTAPDGRPSRGAGGDPSASPPGQSGSPDPSASPSQDDDPSPSTTPSSWTGDDPSAGSSPGSTTDPGPTPATQPSLSPNKAKVRSKAKMARVSLGHLHRAASGDVEPGSP